MAEKKTVAKATRTTRAPARRTASKSTFTAEEKAAMKERAREQRAVASGKSDGEADVKAKIAEMPKQDREMAKRVHAIVKESGPELTPRTYYGMPAYAKDGKVLCYFRSAHKFKTRYATFGFTDKASLDDGTMWPTDYALKDLTAADEKKIRALVKKAVR